MSENSVAKVLPVSTADFVPGQSNIMENLELPFFLWFRIHTFNICGAEDQNKIFNILGSFSKICTFFHSTDANNPVIETWNRGC